jgi:hypothetical protein
MQCIHCGTHAYLRQRKDGRCPKCQRRFVFEPTTDPYRVTDIQLKRAIDRVSGEGKVRFTERHLWYEAHRRWVWSGVLRKPYNLAQDAVMGAIPGALLGFVLSVPALYWLAPVGAAALAGRGAYEVWRFNRRPPFPPGSPSTPFEVFQKQHLARWIHAVGGIRGLLPPREEAAAAMPKKVAADVAAFSFDRAVVTDRWEMAQTLVANRFHFEHNCAVLSLDGFPDGIAGTLKEMLRRNPRLTVFALHDASSDGCQLPLILRGPEWFPDPAVRIVDLGLRPETVRRLRLLTLEGPPVLRPPLPARMLSEEDLTWLAHGNVGELAALRPAQMMRAVYKGIVAAGPHYATGGVPESAGAAYGGGMIWIGDPGGGADTAAVDGFG